jgi:hypothetical protein
MQYFFKRALQTITVILFASLAACETGPQYRTDTSYIAPPTTQGATCVASCETTEQICRGREDDYARAEYPLCMQRAKETYETCINGPFPVGCDVPRQNAEYACDRNASPSYNSCTQSFNACYQSCGGEVVKETVCVRNCD